MSPLKNYELREGGTTMILSGKQIVITGGNTGLGYQTARALAGYDATIILACRNVEAGRKAAATLITETGNTRISASLLDLSKLDTIDRFIERLGESTSCVDVLINNAGVMAVPYSIGEFGFEAHMLINCVGHMVLSAKLSPMLLNAPAPRIVTLSSVGHHYTPVDFDDIDFQNRTYDKWIANAQSKTACSLLAVDLHQRLFDRGVISNAVHPGMIFETGIFRHVPREEFEYIKATAESSPGTLTDEPADVSHRSTEQPDESHTTYKTIEEGVQTTVWAATSDDLAGTGGKYLEDCSIAQLIEEPTFVRGVMPYALDTEAAGKLWQLVENRLGYRLLS